MKKIILFSIVFITSLLSISCEEDFSPFGEFSEKYVLTCILRGDTTFQTATLSSSYFTGTLNPDDNTNDPSIQFADVRIWYEDSVYVLKDTSVVRTDSSRYTTPFTFYFTERFKVGFNKPIEIEVLLQNGRRLRAESFTPKDVIFSTQSSVLIPPVSGNLINIYWGNGNSGAFYLPKLYFRYSVSIDNNVTHYKTEIPVSYSVVDGVEKAVYPSPSNNLVRIYNMETVSRTLEKLPELFDENAQITVYEKLIFTLSIFDENLTRYVSSTSQSFEDLTVRVNENDYSNVEGGLGIFGSYINKDLDRLRFQAAFIQSFGYHFIYENL
ncbi:MAG: hypothetical protein R6W68_05230 [Ignavibacteriaceae bacterium]